MAVIKAPNEDYAGVSAGVVFERGVGHTDDEYLIRWFSDHGYQVEENGQKIAPAQKSARKKKE